MKVREAAKPENRVNTWYVTGDSGQEYIVHHKRDRVGHRKRWTCNCMDFTERHAVEGGICKHIEFVQNNAATVQASTLQQVLDDLIVKINGPRGQDLWFILTALRGPDKNREDVKGQTTARLRYALGLRENGKGFVSYKGLPLGVSALSKTAGEYENKQAITQAVRHELEHLPNQVIDVHFLNHYAVAIMALWKAGYFEKLVP